MPGQKHLGGCNCCCTLTEVCAHVDDCQGTTPLPNKTVELIDPATSTIVDSGTTDVNGEICFQPITASKNYNLKAYIGDYHTATKSFSVPCDTSQDQFFTQRDCTTCVDAWPDQITLTSPFGSVTLTRGVGTDTWTGSQTVPNISGIYECFETSGAPKVNQLCADYDTDTGSVTISYRFGCNPGSCGPTLVRDFFVCSHCVDAFGNPTGSPTEGQIVLDRSALGCGTEPSCSTIPNNFYAYPALDRDQDGIPASDVDCFDCFSIEFTLNFGALGGGYGDEPVTVSRPECDAPTPRPEPPPPDRQTFLSQGRDRPRYAKIEPAPIVPPNEKQKISTSGGSSGFSTVTFELDGDSGSEVTYGDSASTVETALEASASIGAGNVSVTGGPLGTADLDVEFIGSLAGTNVNQLGITVQSPDWTITITTTQNGG